MSERIKIRYFVETNKVGSRVERFVEFDKEDWDEMSESEKDEMMQEYMFELISWDYKVIEK